MKREILKKAKRIVVKVGSSVLCSRQGKLSEERVHQFVGDVLAALRKGKDVIVVSSGAIACGMDTLGLKRRPTELALLQACAAIGQGKLIHLYDSFFHTHGYRTAQVLLTRDGLEDRERYLNAKRTIESLLELKAVPVINENDTISTEEITFGDNDTLSALVAHLVGADLLILLSDVDGFYVKEGEDLKVVNYVERLDRRLEEALFDTQRDQTVGGMKSKLAAARMVMSSGIPLVIANGNTPGILQKVMDGEETGTLFLPSPKRRGSKKSWLAYSTRPKGIVWVDAGAEKVLRGGGKSLLASGVTGVEGRFEKGDTVRIANSQTHREFARGLVGFSSETLRHILGKKSAEIRAILGPEAPSEVVHCDNMVLAE